MRFPLLPFLILLAVCVCIDAYISRCLSKRCSSRIPVLIHWIIAAAFYCMAVVTVALPHRSGSEGILIAKMWMLFAIISAYASKFLFIIFDLLSKLPYLWRRRRVRWLGRLGVCLGVILFAAMWWGALINRFNLQVRDITIPIEGLPAPFNGFRILQISDLHVGTYGNDTEFIQRLVEKVNSLKPDVIVFTGDIVNMRTEELLPHADVLSRMSAPYGVFSILGNHDYGDYSEWPDESAKSSNLERLVYLQREKMGWRLLLNETAWLHVGNDSIALIGVENVGDPPFTVYGSLSKAYPQINDSVIKVLLSHNPAHWTDSIEGNSEANVHLTLSGHTHAMQMALGQVSPAILRYRTWGGLYVDSLSSENKKHLYVNIGIGTVGLPMRVGATPEITLITLRPSVP